MLEELTDLSRLQVQYVSKDLKQFDVTCVCVYVCVCVCVCVRACMQYLYMQKSTPVIEHLDNWDSTVLAWQKVNSLCVSNNYNLLVDIDILSTTIRIKLEVPGVYLYMSHMIHIHMAGVDCDITVDSAVRGCHM